MNLKPIYVMIYLSVLFFMMIFATVELIKSVQDYKQAKQYFETVKNQNTQSNEK